ncbi:MAG: Lipopolysaccharide heptosyltransferase [Thermodesulfobacteriota bacterium]|nr:Lipopolysaccharide heptosyltransferase [Thermodesulfobacteriota bacterium]
MAERLRKRSFDFVILFQNAFESAFTSFLARIPLRAGYATDLRGPLLNVRIPFPPNIRNQHQAFYYLGIYEFIASLYPGHGKHEIDEPDCTIPFSSSSKQKAREMVLQIGGDDRKPIFCLCPGSANSQAKRWPQDYFAELADLLTEQYGAQVVFCGSPEETELIEQIISIQQKPSGVNMSGRTDILGMMALMSCSLMVISNDTGSAHLAAAASATVVTLFGPTSPGATAPLGSRAHTLEGTASCAPCRHFKCPDPAHPCMRSLTPRHVLESIHRILVSERS